MSKRMCTREELLAEIDGLDLPEQTLETFRRVVNTVEEDLTPDQWRDYELDLDKYQRTMGMIRTGRIEGREEGRALAFGSGWAEPRRHQALAEAVAGALRNSRPERQGSGQRPGIKDAFE